MIKFFKNVQTIQLIWTKSDQNKCGAMQYRKTHSISTISENDLLFRSLQLLTRVAQISLPRIVSHHNFPVSPSNIRTHLPECMVTDPQCPVVYTCSCNLRLTVTLTITLLIGSN